MSGDQKKSISDLIGEKPYDKRQRLKAEKEAELSDDELRVIAMNKGLTPF